MEHVPCLDNEKSRTGVPDFGSLPDFRSFDTTVACISWEPVEYFARVTYTVKSEREAPRNIRRDIPVAPCHCEHSRGLRPMHWSHQMGSIGRKEESYVCDYTYNMLHQSLLKSQILGLSVPASFQPACLTTSKLRAYERFVQCIGKGNWKPFRKFNVRPELETASGHSDNFKNNSENHWTDDMACDDSSSASSGMRTPSASCEDNLSDENCHEDYKAFDTDTEMTESTYQDDHCRRRDGSGHIDTQQESGVEADDSNFWTWDSEQENWYHEDKKTNSIIWCPAELD